MSHASLFPTCATCGPLFIVTGCVLPQTIASPLMAFSGAGATSYALHTIYKMLVEQQPQAETAIQSSAPEAEASNP